MELSCRLEDLEHSPDSGIGLPPAAGHCRMTFDPSVLISRSRPDLDVRRPRLVAVGVLAPLLILAAAGPALGQGYVQAPCPTKPMPAFEDALQPLWYRRFWTGECKDLSVLKCRRGKPYWNDVVHTLAARAPAAKRAEVTTRACRLGRQIGFEWTRPSAERRIDTTDLKTLNATLERSPDVLTGLSTVEANVRTKITR
jgi:hypothetical protein